MEKIRKIEKVWRRTTHEQSAEDDLNYWYEKSWQERLREVQDLREFIWNSFEDGYPSQIEIAGGKKIKTLTDEDDF